MASPCSHVDENVASGCPMDPALTFESGSLSTSPPPTNCDRERAATRRSQREQRDFSAPIARQSNALLGPELHEYNEQQQKYRGSGASRSLSRRVFSESDHHHFSQPSLSHHPLSLSFLRETISVGKIRAPPEIIVSGAAATECFSSSALPSAEVAKTPRLTANQSNLTFSPSATDSNVHPNLQSTLRASCSTSDPEDLCAALAEVPFTNGSSFKCATLPDRGGSPHAAPLVSSFLSSSERGLVDWGLAVSEPTVSRNDMAASIQRISGEGRRYPSSGQFNNRHENQRPMNNLLCRNGPQCIKNQEGKCNYNHDFSSISQSNGLSSQKKSLNVDSPSFTPTFTPKTANAQPTKSLGLSPKAAAAASFTPRGSGSVTPAGGSHSKVPSNEFVPSQAFQPTQQFSEFVPGQSFVPHPQITQQQNVPTPINAFADPFLNQQTIQHSIAGLDGSQAQFNAFQPSVSTVSNQSYYHDTTGFKHPLNYHLSAAVGPRRDNMQPYQRASADFFVPDDLREELHKKADAALQTFANSTLPQQVEHFHSLVALDTNNQQGQSFFGYPSWVYKAISIRDGHIYALRRIAGFRLTSEQAITSFHAWKRVNSASLVKVHDAFTGKMFGDSSLVVVTDYHPLSQTLADKHFPQGRANRSGNQVVPENDLWGYIVQLGNALKAVHEAGLAAKTVTASKILVTSKNRLRLNGCGVLDILQYEQRPQTTELQRMDIQDLGRLILSIAVRNPTVTQNTEKALQLAHRTYSERFIACLQWLLSPPVTSHDDQSSPHQSSQSPSSDEYNVTTLLNNIADKVISTLDSALHSEDELTSYLSRELENGRLFRLLTKINVILERPESTAAGSSGTTPNTSVLNQPSSAWSETGERYYLKLFRDYVFHQVDHNGRPVLDLGHIITCLNKLDAGVDENIQLVSRDEQDLLIASYKEVKRGFENAWAELSKASTPSRR